METAIIQCSHFRIYSSNVKVTTKIDALLARLCKAKCRVPVSVLDKLNAPSSALHKVYWDLLGVRYIVRNTLRVESGYVILFR
jgi:hypothetical protein